MTKKQPRPTSTGVKSSPSQVVGGETAKSARLPTLSPPSTQSSTTECDNDGEGDNSQGKAVNITSPSVVVKEKARKKDGPRSSESREEGEYEEEGVWEALDLDEQADNEDKRSQVETVSGEDEEIGVVDGKQKSAAEKKRDETEKDQDTSGDDEQEVAKKHSKKRVPTRNFEREEEMISAISKSLIKKRKEVETDSDEEEVAPPTRMAKNDYWVDIPADKEGDSDTDMEESTPVERITSKKMKRVPLAEKSSNTQEKEEILPISTKKQVKKNAKQAPKKQVKKEIVIGKTNSVRRRSEKTEDVVERKPTRRQSDLRERVDAKASQQLHTTTLVLPGRFEPICKKVLQKVMKDEAKAHEQDSVILMLDLFRFYNEASLIENEPKERRLIRMSKKLRVHLKDADAMRKALNFFQQRVLLWCAGADAIGESSGLSAEQAVLALKMMVEAVDEHGPDDRWYELRRIRQFKLNGRVKVETMFKHLVEAVEEGLEDGKLEP